MRQLIRSASAIAVIVTVTTSGRAESFRVHADDSIGARTTSRGNTPITIEFFAHGRWNYNPGHSNDHGPTGVPLIGTRSHRLPGARVGSLIVRRGDGRYEYVGRHRKFTLRPHEVLYFMINDEWRDHAYWDNTGSVTVYWRIAPDVWRVDQ